MIDKAVVFALVVGKMSKLGTKSGLSEEKDYKYNTRFLVGVSGRHCRGKEKGVELRG